MITADTITDEQIRALRDSVGTFDEGTRGIGWTCATALGDVMHAARHEVRNARARCAEVLNARANGASK